MLPAGTRCKGSWVLGTACGNCEACLEDARRVIPMLREEAAQAERLRGNLRVVTDALAMLLQDEKFPTPGHSDGSRDFYHGWWEDRVQWTQDAYATLANVSHIEWHAKHPGLYVPPPGKITV